MSELGKPKLTLPYSLPKLISLVSQTEKIAEEEGLQVSAPESAPTVSSVQETNSWVSPLNQDLEESNRSPSEEQLKTEGEKICEAITEKLKTGYPFFLDLTGILYERQEDIMHFILNILDGRKYNIKIQTDLNKEPWEAVVKNIGLYDWETSSDSSRPSEEEESSIKEPSKADKPRESPSLKETVEKQSVSTTQNEKELKRALFKDWIGFQKNGVSFSIQQGLIKELYKTPPEDLRDGTLEEIIKWILENSEYAEAVENFDFTTLREM
nr:MAG: hypothetical protein [brine shrimp rhabdovirus 1]